MKNTRWIITVKIRVKDEKTNHDLQHSKMKSINEIPSLTSSSSDAEPTAQ